MLSKNLMVPFQTLCSLSLPPTSRGDQTYKECCITRTLPTAQAVGAGTNQRLPPREGSIKAEPHTKDCHETIYLYSNAFALVLRTDSPLWYQGYAPAAATC
jgi:hypothetical protein